MKEHVMAAVTSAPAKIILFGEHGVNRQQPALATAVDLRTYCRVTRRDDRGFSLAAGARREEGDLAGLAAFKAAIDGLREAKALDAIREQARDFFAPTRYVLAHVAERTGAGFDVTWRSDLPIGSGLGSGAAANTSMVLAALIAAGRTPDPKAGRDEIVQMAWQGDIIAHGGVASSLDSSTSTYGGLVRYTTAHGAEVLPFSAHLPIVIGDTQVQHNTAALNTHVRRWLEERPVRMRLFGDMGWIVGQATAALRAEDLPTLGHLMSIHQLFQEKMGTSIPKAEQLIEAALTAGALGAKISGSGGGGIIIALAQPADQAAVAAAIQQAGGRSFIATSGADGARVETDDAWATLAPQESETD
jgi:mevalonate kinase